MTDLKEKRKAGIVADNYKLDMFKKELADAGFTEYTITDFDKSKTMSLIKVEIVVSDMYKAQRIVQKIDFHFKHRN